MHGGIKGGYATRRTIAVLAGVRAVADAGVAVGVAVGAEVGAKVGTGVVAEKDTFANPGDEEVSMEITVIVRGDPA